MASLLRLIEFPLLDNRSEAFLSGAARGAAQPALQPIVATRQRNRLCNQSLLCNVSAAIVAPISAFATCQCNTVHELLLRHTHESLLDSAAHPPSPPPAPPKL
jgi:hypothetical protein